MTRVLGASLSPRAAIPGVGVGGGVRRLARARSFKDSCAVTVLLSSLRVPQPVNRARKKLPGPLQEGGRYIQGPRLGSCKEPPGEGRG